jgi:predicted metal-dependent peptidase
MRYKFEEVALTPLQAQAWNETKTALIWQAPGFAHILYSMLNLKKDDGVLFWTRQIKTLCTDGRAIAANPDFFFALPLPNRVFAVCHEVAHAMFNHCEVGYQLSRVGLVSVYLDGKWQKIEYQHPLANISMDYVINDLLVESNIGRIHKNWLHDTKIGTHANTWVEVYGKLYQPPPEAEEPEEGEQGEQGEQPGRGDGNIPDEGKGGQPGEDEGKESEQGEDNQQGKGGNGTQPPQPTMGPGQFDEHMAPGTIEGKDPEECKTNETQWQQAIAAGMEIARAQGKLPGAMEQFFQKFLQPVVAWQDEIRADLARKAGSGGYDFRRAHRRLIVRDIYAPSLSGNGCDTIVVAVDTSGSVFAVQHLLDRWFSEMGGMLSDLRPRRIIVIQCDAEVQAVDEIEDEADLETYKAKPSKGGGGTDFRPVFDYLEKEEIKPDCLVYLTDMWGDFPAEDPGFDVIWGSITPEGGFTEPPFGKIVYIPTDGTA